MSAFSADDYWTKARLFANRATEPGNCRSEDERRLWASLALESLAKWALARLSPVLVADPIQGDGKQLLKALGLEEGGPSVAVMAKTAYLRCAKVFRPFDAKAAEVFSHARNEYLHGTDIMLLNIPADRWWSDFWSLANILLAAHQRDFSDLIGTKRAPEAETYLKLNAQFLAQRLEALLEAAKKGVERFAAGHMGALEAKRWEAWDGRAWSKYYDVSECPACGGEGIVEGEEATDGEIVWPETEFDSAYRARTWYADHFSCETCHLVLEGVDLIEEAEILTEYEYEDYDDVFEHPEYGND